MDCLDEDCAILTNGTLICWYVMKPPIDCSNIWCLAVPRCQCQCTGAQTAIYWKHQIIVHGLWLMLVNLLLGMILLSNSSSLTSESTAICVAVYCQSLVCQFAGLVHHPSSVHSHSIMSSYYCNDEIGVCDYMVSIDIHRSVGSNCV
jgi:hypothetical protein